MTLGRRFVASGLWATGASVVGTLVLVARSIILARLLPVEVFGVYAFAAALVGLTVGIARFGLGQALLHRADETADVDRAAAVHFTLTLIFATLWAAAILLVAMTLFDGPQRVALIVLTGAQLGLQSVATPIALLRRQVNHRLLAVLRIVNALTASALALGLAWAGQDLWALLIIDAVTSTLTVAVLVARGPRWRPRVLWDVAIVRYFLSFGGHSMVGRVLEDALQRIDKLWTGAMMSHEALGLYSRSSVYSRAPIDLLARPLASITTGAYAELKGDRGRLTRAVSRVAALLLYGSGLLAVVVGMMAPELIVLLIGAKWLPMLDSFRILLLASVPAALNRNFGQLVVAMGEPAANVRIAGVRLLLLGTGITMLGPAYGLVGVAVSVLAASLVGLMLLLHKTRGFVDLAGFRVFGPVLPAAVAALLAGTAIAGVWPADTSLWIRIIGQGSGAAVAYLLVLLALQGRALREDLGFVLRHLGTRPTDPPSGAADDHRV